MPIPTSRAELVDQVSVSFARLRNELDSAGAGIAHLKCVDEWTVKDLLAVRSWWTHAVIDWVEAGRLAVTLMLPAAGYRWNETPRLNRDIVAEASNETYGLIIDRLEEGFSRVIPCIDSLNDQELLEAGVFTWAGRWPVSRWISINTARQYVTARTYVRRAVRMHAGAPGLGGAS